MPDERLLRAVKGEMGLAGRAKMEKEFDRQIVVKMVVDEIG